VMDDASPLVLVVTSWLNKSIPDRAVLAMHGNYACCT